MVDLTHMRKAIDAGVASSHSAHQAPPARSPSTVVESALRHVRPLADARGLNVIVEASPVACLGDGALHATRVE